MSILLLIHHLLVVLPVISGPQLTNHHRRKPAPCCRTLGSAASQDAAEKIALVADLQAQYYAEKLAMKRQQHELLLQEHTNRMRVLDLQEKLAARKLEKLKSRHAMYWTDVIRVRTMLLDCQMYTPCT